jgi:hypothetical protein
VAGRFRVAECQALPERSGLVIGELEQVAHRVALEIGGTQKVLDGELPPGEIALEREFGDLHVVADDGGPSTAA